MKKMTDYTAVYDTEKLKDVHYSFKSENLDRAIDFCKFKFNIPVHTIIEHPDYDDKSSWITHKV